MEEFNAVPAVSDSFEFPSEVEYLDETVVDPVVNTSATTVNYTTEAASSGGFNNVFNAEYLESLELMDLVQMAVVYAFIIAAALSAVFIFVGGMSFILSGGNDEKIKQAVNTIRYAIIGLIITILSFTFVTIVGKMFGLNLLDYLSYGQIRNAINRIIPKSAPPVETFDVQS